MAADDPSIPSDEVLYRRIARDGDASMIVIDEATGNRKVRSGAFVMDDDGCSVYLRTVLSEIPLGVSDLVRNPQNVIISVTSAEVRGVELGVRPDPWPPESDGHPRDAAHALIVNPSALGSKRRHRAFKQLAAAALICWAAD